MTLKKANKITAVSHQEFLAIRQHINYIEEKIEKMDILETKLDWVIEKIDWLVGTAKNHEEEHNLINHRLSEHSDQIEIIAKRVGVAI